MAGNEGGQFLHCRKGADVSVGKQRQEMSVQTRTISRMWGLVAMLVLLSWVETAV